MSSIPKPPTPNGQLNKSTSSAFNDSVPPLEFQNYNLKNFNFIDRLVSHLGQKISYLILPMVFLTFIIVVLRYTFGISRVWLQELLVYFHVLIFAVGISYNFLQNSHVRVDVFYSRFSERNKTLTDLLGLIFFVWPVIILIFFHSLPYVNQSFKVLESSSDAGGLPARYLLKSFILILCFLIFLQTSSLVYKKIIFLKRGK